MWRSLGSGGRNADVVAVAAALAAQIEQIGGSREAERLAVFFHFSQIGGGAVEGEPAIGSSLVSFHVPQLISLLLHAHFF